MKRILSITVIVFLLWTNGLSATESLPPASQKLYEQASSGKWFREAQRLSPDILPTSDGRSFVSIWKPSGTLPKLWVVSLHGSSGFATDDLAIWHKYLAPRGIGLVTLQWWFGDNQGPRGYYQPEDIYRELEIALKRLGVRPGTAMLHGFSRGSANLYAVAALAASRQNSYFSLFVANAGRASLDYPPTRALMEGRFGQRPLEKTRWVTVCGDRDTNPERDGCPGMRATGQWLVAQGAQLTLAIEDPQGDHGVFHRNPKHVNQVLDLFQGIVQKNVQPGQDNVRPS